MLKIRLEGIAMIKGEKKKLEQIMTVEEIKNMKCLRGHWVFIGETIRDKKTSRLIAGKVLVYEKSRKKLCQKAKKFNLNDFGAFYIGEPAI